MHFTAVQAPYKDSSPAVCLHLVRVEFVQTYLCAHNFPIGALASVTVFIPFGSISSDMSIDQAMFSGHCVEKKDCVGNMYTKYDFCVDFLFFFGHHMTTYFLDTGVQSCLVDTGSDIR